MPDPMLLDLLEDGTRRLIRGVDAMADDDWAAPSLLPGWTRSHVVAHLVLNAEALSASLDGVREGVAVPMYASQEGRDCDINDLSGATPAELRERLLGTTTAIGDRVAQLPDNLAGSPIERVPGGSTFPAGAVLTMRVREVEIHHADLGLGFSAQDWSPEFVALLLDSRGAAHDAVPGFTAYATDLARSWAFGANGPTVSGPGSALAWWATGRGSGEGLTSDDGPVPQMGAW